jgi:hypothetical protein
LASGGEPYNHVYEMPVNEMVRRWIGLRWQEDGSGSF